MLAQQDIFTKRLLRANAVRLLRRVCAWARQRLVCWAAGNARKNGLCVLWHSEEALMKRLSEIIWDSWLSGLGSLHSRL